MEDKLKVIFIEDDLNLGSIISMALQSKGYEVRYANMLSGIQDMIEKECPNILLLDLEVGNQNTLDQLPFIRSKHPSLPILIASSHNEGEEITRCYEAGANHYTKKPYDIQEIDFLIQRFCKKASPISNSISIGDYQLELSTHKLFYKQELSKTLSPKDFKLFYLLSEQLNQPVSREKLFHEIWDGQEVHDSLNNSISRLRKLLEKDTTLSIDAVKGVGYILSKKDQLSSS
ncbi:response regulator transcription factor [Parabacteroides distasonis]|uniref:DNA-binding response regulator n=1 Tax=Parabacteroides distasonis TaxID=823 RepID=A0A3L7ZV03_PARDI|nr:response regulator transcription factor [Parabacteroides distasonis]NBH89390.1 DNA-binding response regulator [Parabacteroides distasonis]RLT74777.1 DNA-binding response regulator [Parabacteroides distasonis]TGY54332.1 response regulator transcription factor [Parabacteroides distasonis]